MIDLIKEADLIEEHLSEWIGQSHPVTSELLSAIVWALASDDDLRKRFDDLVDYTHIDLIKTRIEADFAK